MKTKTRIQTLRQLLSEKWHGSDAYITTEGHIKFDAGDGVFAYIKTGVVDT
jgi:hypothetical protein